MRRFRKKTSYSSIVCAQWNLSYLCKENYSTGTCATLEWSKINFLALRVHTYIHTLHRWLSGRPEDRHGPMMIITDSGRRRKISLADRPHWHRDRKGSLNKNNAFLPSSDCSGAHTCSHWLHNTFEAQCVRPNAGKTRQPFLIIKMIPLWNRGLNQPLRVHRGERRIPYILIGVVLQIRVMIKVKDNSG